MDVSCQLFEVTDGLWRIVDRGRRMADARLSFAVSKDEEYVKLSLITDSAQYDLEDRMHHYLLLTLARRRIQDREQGIVESACGWIHQDELAHDPMMAPPNLNLNVHRIRRQFAAYDFTDPDMIIERRVRVRELRIGVGGIDIVRL